MSELMPLHEIAKELRAHAQALREVGMYGPGEIIGDLARGVERPAGQQLDRETATLNAAAAAVRDMAEQRPIAADRANAASLAMDALDMGLPGRFVRLLRVKVEHYGADQREQGHQQGRAEALKALGTALGAPV